MSWEVIGRELGHDEWHVLEKDLPCPEDAIYKTTEHQQAMGEGWKVVPRQVFVEVKSVSVDGNYQPRKEPVR